MNSDSTSFDLLMELESRHEELLMRLDELDQRVEKTLRECQSLRLRPDAEMPTRKAG
jgi:regulator of replication initiation timing